MSDAVDLSGLGSFDFAPSWATKSEKVTIGKVRPEREARPSGDRDRKGFGDRKPAGDRKPFGERKPFGDRKPAGDRKPFGDRKPMGERKNFGERRPRFEERPRPLDVEVKILPETKALGTIIRKLQGDIHAYKLKDLAYFFLDNPESVLLKVSPKKAANAESTNALSFHQCKACGFASTKEEEVIDHVIAVHLGDYYDSKEVEVEPPKGNFNCVAKCGLSGVLLGPPNIHEFNGVVREMIRTRYPDMSEAQYRAHIEMVRDAESIEAWRQSATKQTIFFAKGTAEQEGAKGLTRTEAESEFRRNYLAAMLDQPKNLMITADQALKSPVKPLVWAVKDALEAERRQPYNMIFALRGAFHHRKLKFFRVNDARGQEFVTNVEYKEFDTAHAIPELAAMAKFVAEHPCCDLKELPAGEDSLKHLQWLVSTGHVVAFTNGVYSAVEKYPKYGPQWKKRAAAKPAADEPPKAAEAEAAKTAEEPAVEAPTAPVETTTSGQQQEAPAVETPVAEPAAEAVGAPVVEAVAESAVEGANAANEVSEVSEEGK